MMSRFYFHVTDGRRVYPDPVGTELSDPSAVRSHALADARQLLTSWMAKSSSPWRIQVVDDQGAPVLSMALVDAAVSEAAPLYGDEIAA